MFSYDLNFGLKYIKRKTDNKFMIAIYTQ